MATLTPSLRERAELGWVAQPCLHELHPQLPTDRLRRPGERAESDGLVLGIEQAVELRPAGLHALGKRRLREFLILHERAELARDHAFDGPCRYLFVDA